jgi:hypothetical protein
MESALNSLFTDKYIVERIRFKLPRLFQLAELESQRNGKVGMEVGSSRERILIALLMYKYGLDDVNPDIPITESQFDVFVKGQPVSIKTVTTKNDKWNNGVKLSWTVDKISADKFGASYLPSCDILLAQIQWESLGNLFLIPIQAQSDILNAIGREKYLKLPKLDTNARGVELTSVALASLTQHPLTKKIEIFFVRKNVDYRQIYTKWLEAWHD